MMNNADFEQAELLGDDNVSLSEVIDEFGVIAIQHKVQTTRIMTVFVSEVRVVDEHNIYDHTTPLPR